MRAGKLNLTRTTSGIRIAQPGEWMGPLPSERIVVYDKYMSTMTKRLQRNPELGGITEHYATILADSKHGNRARATRAWGLPQRGGPAPLTTANDRAVTGGRCPAGSNDGGKTSHPPQRKNYSDTPGGKRA